MEKILFTEVEGGKEIFAHDVVSEGLRRCSEDNKPWMCKADSSVMEKLYGETGVLKGPVDGLRHQFTRSSLRVTDGKAVMPLELSPDSPASLQEVIAQLCAGEEGDLFSLEVATEFPNLAKAVRPSLFALTAGRRQPPRLESGALGKLRLTFCGSRRVWLINAPQFCAAALGRRSAPAGEFQQKLHTMAKTEIEELARRHADTFQWVSLLVSTFCLPNPFS